jgi:hypothetical protein
MIPLAHKVTALHWTTTLHVYRLLLDIYTLWGSRAWRRLRNISLILIHVASNFTTNNCACDST